MKNNNTFEDRFVKGMDAAWEGLKTLASTKGNVFESMDTVREELKQPEKADGELEKVDSQKTE